MATSSIQSATESSSQALEQLKKALCELSDEETQAYWEARQTVPDLCQRETDPLEFLRFEHGDAKAAAQRLAAHWKFRKSLFGKYTFLPMDDLSGAGLLRSNEISVLKTGFLAPIVDTSSGNTPLLCFNSHWIPKHDKLGVFQATLRCWFFVLSKLGEEESRVNGPLSILRIMSPGLQALTVQIMDMLNSAFLVRIGNLHIVSVGETPEDLESLRHDLVPVVERCRARCNVHAHVYLETSTEALLAKLKDKGIPETLLPEAIGGSYVEPFASWLEKFLLPKVSGRIKGTRKRKYASFVKESEADEGRDGKPRALPHGRGSSNGSEANRLHGVPRYSNATDDDESHPRKDPSSSKHDNNKSLSDVPMGDSVSIRQKYIPISGERKQKALRDLEEALQRLPTEETSALNQARKDAPELCEREADMLRYLYCEEYNFEAAAKRLAFYWTTRKKLFAERALLPLDPSGSGALSEEDIEILRTGFVALISNDDYPMPIICFNKSRCPDTVKHVQCKLRSMFYLMASVSMQQDAALLQGWACIRVLYQSSKTSLKDALTILGGAFPMKCRHAYLLSVSPPGSLSTMRKVLEPVLAKPFDGSECQLHVHIESSKKNLLSKVSVEGLSKAVLPAVLGGSWSYDKFNEWLKERAQVDRNLHSADNKSGNTVTEECHCESAATAKQSTTPADDTRKVLQAIRKLPIEVKGAYLETKKAAPYLIETDSPPYLYFAYAERNAEAAAQYLCSYWTRRKELFGCNFLLPLDQTGEGALGRNELTLLSSAFLELMPGNSSEKLILCYDGNRVAKSPRKCQMRVAFYWFSLVIKNHASTPELVILHIIDKVVTNSRDRRESLDTVLDSFPIRVKAAHAIVDTKTRCTDKTIVKSVEKVFGSQCAEKAIVYRNMTKDAVAKRLGEHGLTSETVPISIGGEWNYSCFVQWQELQMRLEWQLPPGTGGENVLRLFDFSGTPDLADMTEDEKVERKRRMNVLHSRRKRERERIEVEVLREQCDYLVEKNIFLREENVALTNSLHQAKRSMSREAPHETTAEVGCTGTHPTPSERTVFPESRYQQNMDGVHRISVNRNSVPRHPVQPHACYANQQQLLPPLPHFHHDNLLPVFPPETPSVPTPASNQQPPSPSETDHKGPSTKNAKESRSHEGVNDGLPGLHPPPFCGPGGEFLGVANKDDPAFQAILTRRMQQEEVQREMEEAARADLLQRHMMETRRLEQELLARRQVMLPPIVVLDPPSIRVRSVQTPEAHDDAMQPTGAQATPGVTEAELTRDDEALQQPTEAQGAPGIAAKDTGKDDARFR